MYQALSHAVSWIDLDFFMKPTSVFGSLAYLKLCCVVCWIMVSKSLVTSVFNFMGGSRCELTHHAI